MVYISTYVHTYVLEKVIFVNNCNWTVLVVDLLGITRNVCTYVCYVLVLQL